MLEDGMRNLTLFNLLPEDTVWDSLKTNLGNIYFLADSEYLYGILWESDFKSNKNDFDQMDRASDNQIMRKAKKQINEYLVGQRKEFDLPIKLLGSSFQLSVWKALESIPYGETFSYKEQSILLGSEKKVRAVGSANGKNPISIVVPCHRVIASNGDLAGYAGGLKIKELLLAIEAR